MRSAASGVNPRAPPSTAAAVGVAVAVVALKVVAIGTEADDFSVVAVVAEVADLEVGVAVGVAATNVPTTSSPRKLSTVSTLARGL